LCGPRATSWRLRGQRATRAWLAVVEVHRGAQTARGRIEGIAMMPRARARAVLRHAFAGAGARSAAESSRPPAPARIQADQGARPALTPRLELASELRNDVEPARRGSPRQRRRDGALYSIITTSRTWRLVRRSWRFVRRRQNRGVLAATLGGWVPVFSRRWATFGTDGAVGFDSPWGRTFL
jgi:hypothetical protein